MANVHVVQTILLLLLIMVAVFAVMARRLKVPYPIVLVIAGLLISFVPHMPRVPLSPDVVFLVVLPPLLFAAAWQTSWREFRRNLVAISLLAVGLVAFTVWGVSAVGEHVFSAFDWKSGFLLGAVVATTDAIAATSIAKTIGLPHRIVHILEGESLLNDATGLLALEFGLRIVVQGESPTLTGGLVRLVWLAVAGVAAGLVVGAVAVWCERWIDDGDIEIVISIVVPYLAYLAAEEMRASGVLAVVACGLLMSRQSVRYLTPEVRIQITSVWRALNFALNGLVFVLIGLQLPYVLAAIAGYSLRMLVLYGAAFGAVLIALRLIWVFPSAAVAHLVRTRLMGSAQPGLSVKEQFVIGWTGMRGVIALAAAFSLPVTLADGRPFVQRPLILFLTFSVILLTLVVQGLTLPMLIRWLGLSGHDSAEVDEESRARRRMLDEAIAHLQVERAGADKELQHGYDDLLHAYRHRLSQAHDLEADACRCAPRAALHRQLRTVAGDAVHVERQALIRMRDEGAIGDDVLRRLERELDLTEARQGALPAS